ncbi:Ger(x)C family germination protein [Paenibacillus endophyticus]|uniref:Ger(X)C family germination protein n=2 Tax=Paenibacillus endophyticus TaxID=1294268 RepID=A0A7W5C9M1_9BACL|nr:Ger(x)C family germination protein [Paenibacillus endophyticus]
MMRMNTVKIILSICLLTCTAGCSADVTEISDIALVTATGIDYDKKTKKYTFTSYCLLPTTTSTANTGKLSDWVVSASGSSILDAAKKLRSQVGKTLIWQHNKFIIIGEGAARYSFYEIMDFMIRNRQIRITSFLFVSKGRAVNLLHMNTETEDLLSNDLLGKVRNEKDWGRSISQSIQNIANWNTDPYRGFVAGKISKSRHSFKSKDALSLSGGSVFNHGKWVGWLDEQDVLVVHLLSDKSKWKNLTFSESFPFHDSNVTLHFKLDKQSIQCRDTDGPTVDIHLSLTSTVGEIEHYLSVDKLDTIIQLEHAASTFLENKIKHSLSHFQKDLNVDVIGFSDLFYQHYPKEWAALKHKWSDIYPTIPVQAHVTVKIDKLGLNQYLGDH